MQALLFVRGTRGILLGIALWALLPGLAAAGWWHKPAPQPAIPVGPPIYTPATPTVVGYQPAPPVAVPTNVIPANVAPTLGPTVVAPAPAVVAPAPTTCGHCGPHGHCGHGVLAPRVTNYVPPNYRTNWLSVPTTTYRPVASVDPATGLPINAVQPCTTNTWHARKVPNSLWGGLWPTTAARPNVVAYTPATIAAYPAAPITTYSPPTTILAPSARAPVVTQYAPAPAPVVTQYAPAPTITQYAPSPVVAPPPVYAPAPVTPAPVPCPHGCAPGTCPPPTQAAPPPAYGTVAPSASPPAAYGQSGSAEAADLQPRLNGTIRNYAPADYDNQPLVPVEQERRVIETPRIEAPRLQSPQLQAPQNGGASNVRTPAPFVPFARPAEKPASTTTPERNLRLVPDPDAQKLDLRRDEIPSLIKPGDRMTSQPVPQRVTTLRPEMELERPQTRFVPASISAPRQQLDDSGWQSVQQ